VDRLLRGDRAHVYLQVLASPGRGRVVWGFEAEIHQIKQGPQDPLGLSERQTEEQPKSERAFDCPVRVLLRGPAATGWLRVPSFERLSPDPAGDVAALNEGLAVLGPVRDSRLRLVRRVHAEAHACSNRLARA
jgi:hypothetical protein